MKMVSLFSVTPFPKKLLLVAGTGWLFDAMDVGLLSFILAALAIDWRLEAGQIGAIASINSVGMAIGAWLFGYYADRKGRKSAFIFSLLLFSFASGMSAFSLGLTSFVILRFFIGLGLGGELPVAATFVSEQVSPAIRGRIIVLLESFWAIGWLLAAIIAFFVIPIPKIGWRGALLICTLPAFYAFYLRSYLPDPQEASRTQKDSLWQISTQLWSAAFARQTLMLWIVWFCVVFSYYGMFLWLPNIMLAKGFDMIRSFGYVTLITLAQLPGYFSVAWLIEKIGRKRILIIYLFGTVLSGYGFGYSDSTSGLIFYGALLSFFNLGAWGALYAYTPEHYPQSIRATGTGLAMAVGRVGGILGPLMVGLLMQSGIDIGIIFSLFSGSLLLAIWVLGFLGMETKQRILV